MSVIIFFGRAYTGTGQLAEKASDILGYRVMDDREVIETAAREFDLDKQDIEASIFKAPPCLSSFLRPKPGVSPGLNRFWQGRWKRARLFSPVFSVS